MPRFENSGKISSVVKISKGLIFTLNRDHSNNEYWIQFEAFTISRFIPTYTLITHD